MSTGTLAKLYRYRDQHGVEHELWVEAKTWRGLEAIDRMTRRANAKWAKLHTTFTDLPPKTEVEQAPVPVSQGNPWEGPRYTFSRLVGESRTWHGRPDKGSRCTFCNNSKLEPHEYCLGCDRCGRDEVIPKPTAAELKKRRNRQYRPKPGLKGGKS